MIIKVVFGIEVFQVKDATAALIVVLLLFTIPAKTKFLRILHPDPARRPIVPSPPLITWKAVQTKMPWGLIFLLGGGFALAEGSKASGMSDMIADHLEGLIRLPPLGVMVLACLFASFTTDFSSNVAVANVLLPVLAEMSIKARWHPMYLMMPACLACSHAYCLPVGTPPNAIAVAPCGIRTRDLVKAGLGVSIISLVVLLVVFPFLGNAVYNFDEFPSWAV